MKMINIDFNSILKFKLQSVVRLFVFSVILFLQREERAEEADGSEKNREDQPSEDQGETSGRRVRRVGL